ncbi:MAG: hypothetical protein RBS39_02430 [Phycisphaerales bacterium]|jgi:hypothetical protein|nr:hypothetical protein [Phycisphaerales bacterium]
MNVGLASITCVLASCSSAMASGPFATRVMEYRPAPGQFVQHPDFNDPSNALGPPVGAGPFAPDNSKVVTLGGFGGSITLGFDHPVVDDPRNPFGMDAIVFGNSFWVGNNPNRRWAEPATIEISRDVNANGLADDPWYVIPGTYIANPPDAQRVSVVWDDLIADATYPPASAAWIPAGFSGMWTTCAFELPLEIFGSIIGVTENPAGLFAEEEGYLGYADCSPTLPLGDLDGDGFVDDPFIAPEVFYTTPDDPFVVGITPGSGGGDAFDIQWAVDPATGTPARLRSFDFIRITTAIDFVSPLFGERSAEVAGVADVAPAMLQPPATGGPPQHASDGVDAFFRRHFAPHAGDDVEEARRAIERARGWHD